MLKKKCGWWEKGKIIKTEYKLTLMMIVRDKPLHTTSKTRNTRGRVCFRKGRVETKEKK